MAGVNNSWRRSQDNDQDEENFIILSDSEDERHHHSTSSDDENVTIVVPDSSDEATNTSVDYGPADGRITPLIHKAIRRSLRHFEKSSDDETENMSTEDLTQSPMPERKRHLGGTLVVAPVSLVAQWQSEAKNRCKNGLLTVELYHGNNRESNPKRLARNDIVVTTYNILSREAKTSGVLYKIHWKRVVLDEAHVIRNHKSQTCEAVCSVSASKRWVLTGTPVHNKEMDLFSLLKFLKCSPFDDVRKKCRSHC